MDAVAYISSNDIRDALSSLIHPTADERGFDSLCALYLVDEIRNHPDFPPTKKARKFAVFELLGDLIEEKLIYERGLHNIQYAEPEKSLEVALSRIQQDNLTDSMSLLGWSLLYYCYIQVDLNISFDCFAETIGLVERSLRRYRKHAIKRLHNELLLREQKARKQYKARRLLSRLPSVVSSKLIGRQRETEQIYTLIADIKSPTILVTGAVGVGKTALVAKIIQSMLRIGKPYAPQFLCWLEDPRSSDYVIDWLHLDIGFESEQSNLQEWLMMYPTIVVLDNANSLIEDDFGMKQLLEQLNPALVFIVTSSYVVLDGLDSIIVLHELSKSDSMAYLQYLQHSSLFHMPELTEMEQTSVFEVAGGNPRAVMLTAQLLNLGLIEGPSSHDIIHDLYHKAIQYLSSGEILAWCAFVLCPSGLIHLADLFKVWGRLILPDHVHNLAVHFIVESGRKLKTFRLPHSARQFIIQAYNSNDDTYKKAVHVLLSDLSNADNNAFVFKVINYILGLRWISIDTELQNKLLSKFTLEAGGGDLMELHAQAVVLPYAISLRRRGKFAESLSILDNLVHESGRSGDFETQAFVCLEKAILLRLTGEYEPAVTLFENVKRAAERYGNELIRQRVLLDFAQVEIDRMDGNRALSQLEALQPVKKLPLRWHFLMAETYLLDEQVDIAYQISRDLITHVEDDRSRLGWIQALLGRCEMQRSNYDVANYHFKIALTYFDEQLDMVAYTRSLSNLGAAQTNLAAFDEAHINLAKAQKLQQIIGDGLGLVTTNYNLDVLRKFRNGATK